MSKGGFATDTLGNGTSESSFLCHGGCPPVINYLPLGSSVEGHTARQEAGFAQPLQVHAVADDHGGCEWGSKTKRSRVLENLGASVESGLPSDSFNNEIVFPTGSG